MHGSLSYAVKMLVVCGFKRVILPRGHKLARRGTGVYEAPRERRWVMVRATSGEGKVATFTVSRNLFTGHRCFRTSRLNCVTAEDRSLSSLG